MGKKFITKWVCTEAHSYPVEGIGNGNLMFFKTKAEAVEWVLRCAEQNYTYHLEHMISFGDIEAEGKLKALKENPVKTLEENGLEYVNEAKDENFSTIICFQCGREGDEDFYEWEIMRKDIVFDEEEVKGEI